MGGDGSHDTVYVDTDHHGYHETVQVDADGDGDCHGEFHASAGDYDANEELDT